MPTSDDLAELTDALARGHLTLAELAAVESEELRALQALAARQLKSRQDTQAVRLTLALVALHPYLARSWRLLGAAFASQRRWLQAARAYAAALVLEPDHPWCRHQHGLAWTRWSAAQKTEGAIAPKLGPRAGMGAAFQLSDGRTLPLAQGALAAPAPPTAEETAASPSPKPLGDSERSHTKTAIVRHRAGTASAPPGDARPPQAPSPEPLAETGAEGTNTAVLRRRTRTLSTDLSAME